MLRTGDVSFGLGLKPTVGPLSRHRFGVEVGLPIVQSLDGPQLKTSWAQRFRGNHGGEPVSGLVRRVPSRQLSKYCGCYHRVRFGWPPTTALARICSVGQP